MSIKKGKHCEDVACAYLRKRGYKILARNVRYPFGELDIVAMKGKRLVFVEVKGGNPSFHPRTRVKEAKLRKIELAANRFVSDREQNFDECQLDVIEVLDNGEINHLEAIGRW
ncbi:YraN family protein [Kosmotoga pacifica]|uniref:UPF0102 protein IX53_08655 n=1 Tax=Kosmotoga pacifica TaxID=1330330 RepID=A0A0G2ZCP4_9BACT|nr:YraN family protein [Kosmotoga pacifica]AKI97871.1 hypothetical protein IX53_08655 [Kosmotoga pacifica]